MADQRCPKCWEVASTGAKFCRKCGALLAQKETTQAIFCNVSRYVTPFKSENFILVFTEQRVLFVADDPGRWKQTADFNRWRKHYFSTPPEKILAENPTNFALSLDAIQQATMDFPKKRLILDTASGSFDLAIDEDDRLVKEMLRDALGSRVKLIR